MAYPPEALPSGMALGANIQSIDALQTMKAAILKFLHEAEQALAEVDGESQRVADWISHQQPMYWKLEFRKREKEVAQAKDDLRRVQLTISEHKPADIGGMPGVDNPYAFWIFCAIMLVLLVFEVILFRRLKRF